MQTHHHNGAPAAENTFQWEWKSAPFHRKWRDHPYAEEREDHNGTLSIVTLKMKRREDEHPLTELKRMQGLGRSLCEFIDQHFPAAPNGQADRMRNHVIVDVHTAGSVPLDPLGEELRQVSDYFRGRDMSLRGVVVHPGNHLPQSVDRPLHLFEEEPLPMLCGGHPIRDSLGAMLDRIAYSGTELREKAAPVAVPESAEDGEKEFGGWGSSFTRGATMGWGWGGGR